MEIRFGPVQFILVYSLQSVQDSSPVHYLGDHEAHHDPLLPLSESSVNISCECVFAFLPELSLSESPNLASMPFLPCRSYCLILFQVFGKALFIS